MQSIKVYTARRLGPVAAVTVVVPGHTPYALRRREDVVSHSPDGFEWGYTGSGPAQLALALLCDAIGVSRARPIYQAFKREIVSVMPGEGWTTTSEDLVAWAVDYERRFPPYAPAPVAAL